MTLKVWFAVNFEFWYDVRDPFNGDRAVIEEVEFDKQQNERLARRHRHYWHHERQYAHAAATPRNFARLQSRVRENETKYSELPRAREIAVAELAE